MLSLVALLRSFLLYFGLFVMAGHLILYFATPAPVWLHPLTPRNIADELGFGALIFGLFYAPVFDRTRSLLTPTLAHNLANTFLTSIGMIWSAIG